MSLLAPVDNLLEDKERDDRRQDGCCCGFTNRQP